MSSGVPLWAYNYAAEEDYDGEEWNYWYPNHATILLSPSKSYIAMRHRAY